jgi:large subunit ribosomal protein L21
MYAVIETGGKQYRVEVGTELEVELLDVEPGKTITLERVLLVGDGADSSIGRPLVAGAEVSAEVVRQTRGEKLISFKYRPKARSRVKKGHRQELTVLRISDITVGGRSAAKSARKAQEDAKTERQRLEEAAVAQAAKDAELAARLAKEAEVATKPATKAKTGPAAAKAKATLAGAPTAAASGTKARAGKTEPKATPTESKGYVGAPKASRAKASAADSDATATKPEPPKRTRAPKKDA